MNIPETLINSLKQSEIKELVINNSEVVIDNILEDGLLKDIPVLGNLFKIYSVSQNISNNIFTRKLLRFLTEFSEVPEIEREKFVEKLGENLKFKQEVGEKLLLLIDKLDDSKKATYLAKAFKLYLDLSISYKDFLILSYMIDRFNLAYQLELSVCFRYSVSNYFRGEIYDHFLHCGIFQSHGIDSDRIINSNLKLYKSKMGNIFAQKILDTTDDELNSEFINCILNMDISSPIGDYEKDVMIINSRKEAEAFLRSIDSNQFECSFINGKQFLDKERKTRFRRTDIDKYEYFIVTPKN